MAPEMENIREAATHRLGGCDPRDLLCHARDTHLLRSMQRLQLGSRRATGPEHPIGRGEMEGPICWKWRGAEHDTESTSHLFLGMRTRSNICVCPALAEWIADELRKESAISKERRKARGSKSLRRNSSIWGLGFYAFATTASTFDPVLAGDAEFIYFVDIGVVARSAQHRGDLASGDSPIALQGDLFQLPLHVLGDLRSSSSSASRSVRRRDESNAHSLECANDGLRALGQFCGRGRAGGGNRRGPRSTPPMPSPSRSSSSVARPLNACPREPSESFSVRRDSTRRMAPTSSPMPGT